jgi:hypothetical protein
VSRAFLFHKIGTYNSQEAASAAYEAELRKESPDLHTAPKRVERPSNPAPTQRSNPDASAPEQAPLPNVEVAPKGASEELLIASSPWRDTSPT